MSTIPTCCFRQRTQGPLSWATNGRSLRRGGGQLGLRWWAHKPRQGRLRHTTGTRTALELAERNWPRYFSTQGGKGPRSAAEWPAPWKRSFCASGQDRNGTVSWSQSWHLVLLSRCLWLRLSNGSAASNWPGLAFPASAAVEGRQSQRSCLFASGEASGSECLRRPPQIRA